MYVLIISHRKFTSVKSGGEMTKLLMTNASASVRYIEHIPNRV